MRDGKVCFLHNSSLVVLCKTENTGIITLVSEVKQLLRI